MHGSGVDGDRGWQQVVGSMQLAPAAGRAPSLAQQCPLVQVLIDHRLVLDVLGPGGADDGEREGDRQQAACSEMGEIVSKLL